MESAEAININISSYHRRLYCLIILSCFFCALQWILSGRYTQSPFILRSSQQFLIIGPDYDEPRCFTVTDGKERALRLCGCIDDSDAFKLPA